ncbi:hypothetical protein LC608_33080 [Nostoc sp. XA010]|uniref:hypothetical protein n=1 Tax=Nostoc sp. XA010 TaxID=2780407 RepID=UPI001E503CBD|nr:hypothetical protein [Nostoc sp. XA010]MCC5661695.1 hypothetical protein [Nostoc sp. XA010]
MALRKAETSSGQGVEGVGGVGGVGGRGRSLTPHTPHTSHTQKPVKSWVCAYLSAIHSSPMSLLYVLVWALWMGIGLADLVPIGVYEERAD